MRKNFTLFGADADQWESAGMSIADEDSLILALWQWYRGRPNPDLLNPIARVAYAMKVGQLEGSEKLYEARSAAGKKGNEVRWGATRNGNRLANRKTVAEVKSPTATATATTTSTSSNFKTHMGDSPNPPVSVDEDVNVGGVSGGTRSRFVKPTEDDVRAYCIENGFTNVDPAQFVDYYSSKGWMVGKAPMKDWKSAVRNWHRRNQSSKLSAPVGTIIKNASRKEDDYVL